jgi:hypothetical protein
MAVCRRRNYSPITSSKLDRAAGASQLQARLTGLERKTVTEKPTNNLAVYDAYLRALACERRTVRSMARMQEMQRLYEKALRKTQDDSYLFANNR